MPVKIRRKFKLPIAAPGIYGGVAIEDYHSAEFCGAAHAVSSSDLRTCWAYSPRHMFHKWRCNPNRAQDNATKPMILGRATHHLLLGEAHFKTLFVGQPDKVRSEKDGIVPWNNNRTECKEWNEEQRKAGRTILKDGELEAIVGIGRSIAAWPAAMDLLRGEVECSMVARDPETGLLLLARPDAIPTTSGDFADLKTIADISDYGIATAIGSNGYHQQGALVWECCELLGMEFTSFNLVFVESKPPHCVRIIVVDEDDLTRGRLQNRHALRQIRHGIDHRDWPMPGNMHIHPMFLPSWQRDQIDARLQIAGFDHKKERR
jgi:hypothetical protein